MTDTPAGTTSEVRASEVDAHLQTVTDRLCDGHPEVAGPVRTALGGLRDRLRRVHTQCGPTDATVWAAHRAELDRGLAELEVELDRATRHEPSGGPTLDALLFTTVSSLELRAWRLRLDTVGGAPAAVHDLASTARREVDAVRATDDGEARARAARTMEALRRELDDTASGA
ncbi:hypothetical protein [Modestobacter sp. SYSU DS0290]